MARPKGSKNPNAGRKPKWESPEELEELIEKYLKSCWTVKRDMFGNPVKDPETKEEILQQTKPYTISGMALYLDCDRHFLLEYAKKDKFSATIKKARNICQAYAEESLFSNKATGAIFNLKNNYGWKDKTEVDQNVNGDLTVSVVKFL